MGEQPFSISQAMWADAMLGVDIFARPAGTVIIGDAGEELVVDDEHAVQKGRVLYCTQRHYDALKAYVPAATGPFRGIADLCAQATKKKPVPTP